MLSPLFELAAFDALVSQVGFNFLLTWTPSELMWTPFHARTPYRLSTYCYYLHDMTWVSQNGWGLECPRTVETEKRKNFIFVKIVIVSYETNRILKCTFILMLSFSEFEHNFDQKIWKKNNQLTIENKFSLSNFHHDLVFKRIKSDIQTFSIDQCLHLKTLKCQRLTPSFIFLYLIYMVVKYIINLNNNDV